jgi:hypothetical protein
LVSRTEQKLAPTVMLCGDSYKYRVCGLVPPDLYNDYHWRPVTSQTGSGQTALDAAEAQRREKAAGEGDKSLAPATTGKPLSDPVYV